MKGPNVETYRMFHGPLCETYSHDHQIPILENRFLVDDRCCKLEGETEGDDHDLI